MTTEDARLDPQPETSGDDMSAVIRAELAAGREAAAVLNFRAEHEDADGNEDRPCEDAR